MSEISKTVLIIFLPFILGKIFAVAKGLFNWRQHIVFCRPKKTLEKLALALLAVFIGTLIYNTCEPRPLYFSETQTPIDSPAYLIRNKFREYISRRQEADPVFREMVAVRQSMIKDATDPEVLEKVYSSHHALEKHYIEIERLSMELRSKESRRIYLLFGPDAIVCKTCDKSHWSHLALLIPSIIAWYIVALTAIGLATVQPEKSRWRFYSLLAFGIILVYEMYELGFSDSFVIEFNAMSENERFLTRPEQLAVLRNFVFLVMSSLTLIVDFSISADPILRAATGAVRSVEAACSKLQIARLARLAIVSDDALRKHCWDYLKKAETEGQHLFNDPEYKKVQAQLSRKYNIDQLIEKSNASIGASLETIFGKD